MKNFCVLTTFILISLLEVDGQNNLLAVNDLNETNEFSLIDNRPEKAVAEKVCLFKSGILLSELKNSETLFLTYFNKNLNTRYKFLMFDVEGQLVREFRFIKFKEADDKIILDVNGLVPGKYYVEVYDEFGNTTAEVAANK